jgi:hypothetical protein
MGIGDRYISVVAGASTGVEKWEGLSLHITAPLGVGIRPLKPPEETNTSVYIRLSPDRFISLKR